MSPAEVLRAARAKIAAPARWTQDLLARGPDGEERDPNDHLACRWCALGALHAVTPDSIEVMRAGDILLRALPASYELPEGEPEPIADFNDHAEHGDVLALYDRAILAAEAT